MSSSKQKPLLELNAGSFMVIHAKERSQYLKSAFCICVYDSKNLFDALCSADVSHKLMEWHPTTTVHASGGMVPKSSAHLF